MAEYLAPGVYIEEIERGPKPIEGVPTSTAAFLGETERGPVQPRLVTSFNEYRRWFGSVFDDSKYLPNAMASFFDNGGKRCYVARICRTGAAASTIISGVIKLKVNGQEGGYKLKITASGPGKWGNRIAVRVGYSTTTNKGSPIGIKLNIAFLAAEPSAALNSKVNLKEFLSAATGADILDAKKQIIALDEYLSTSLVESFDDLVVDNPSDANYYEKRIDSNSGYIKLEITKSADVATIEPGDKPENGFICCYTLATGLDYKDENGVDNSVLTAVNFKGEHAEPAKRTGLAALLLDQYREVSLVYAPGQTDSDTANALVTHCENNHFRFAVIDCKPNLGNPGSIDPRSTPGDADGLAIDSSYAAYYYPWIKVSDPQTGVKKKIPPGGAMIGIYARTDNERGVFKAPANEIVRGALDLEYNIDEGTQAVLNPRGVNVIRQFPGRGIRAWGARTLSSDALWKYVSVRRLFIFIERSIYEGTQWVVFEPNDERLWARVRDTIRLFLRTQYRAGALMGATEAEAFRITCDRSTMTQDDILNGRLICEIGIAPVRPAEFVIFKVFQSTAEAQN